VAGAELFTGNNLIVMAWADGRVSSAQVLRNWAIVCLANGVGAAGLALLVFASGHASLNGGAVGQQVVQIAVAKQELPFFTALVRGVLCNVLVCMAVWMAMAGRSVTDKAVAVALPVMAFVAAGFEHSIANLYLMPLAMLLQHGGLTGHAAVTWGGMLGNLLPVMLGNVLGGAVLVAGVYHVIYKRPAPV
jgi:formate/nitrite transporter